MDKTVGIIIDVNTNAVASSVTNIYGQITKEIDSPITVFTFDPETYGFKFVTTKKHELEIGINDIFVGNVVLVSKDNKILFSQWKERVMSESEMLQLDYVKTGMKMVSDGYEMLMTKSSSKGI